MNFITMKPGIIIQARTGSVRLPGKVLMPFEGELSILDILIRRLRTNAAGWPVVVATTVNPADDRIEAAASAAGVSVFRGDEQDVLNRFICCAEKYGFDTVARVCADNPFLDAALLEELLVFSSAETGDYFSYDVAPNLPAIRSHWGIFAEVVRTDALRKAAAATDAPLYHEHVTNFIYEHPEQFFVRWIKAPDAIFGTTDVRLTIDTPEDFRVAQTLYARLKSTGHIITFKKILQELSANPSLKEAMQEQIRNNTK